MSSEILNLLHTDDEYVKEVCESTVYPIRDGILDTMDWQLRPYQELYSNKIITETLRARSAEIGAMMSRQSGKTEMTSVSVLTLILFYLNIPLQFVVGWFAPAKSTSIMVARKRLVNLANKNKEFMEKFNVEMVKGYGRERVGTQSPLLNFRHFNEDVEAYVRSLSANPKSNIKGDTLDLIIIEDSQEVDENKMHTDIFPMGSKGAPTILSGVPIPEAAIMNQYYIETFERNPRNAWLMSVDWKRACAFTKEELQKLNAWEEGVDKEYPEEIEAYQNGSDSYRYYMDRYRDHVLKTRGRLLKRNPEAFLSQYELRWFAGAGRLMTLDDVLELKQQYEGASERLRFWGLDIAKVSDSTVCWVIERFLGEHHLIGLFERTGTDYPTQAKEFVPWLKQFTPLRYGFIDETGAGEVFIDLIRKDLTDMGCSWDGFNFSNRKQVNQMFQLFCMDLRMGRIHYSENVDKDCLNVMIDQLSTVQRIYHGHYLWLEAPQGYHDDYPTAGALARYASEEKNTGVWAIA